MWKHPGKATVTEYSPPKVQYMSWLTQNDIAKWHFFQNKMKKTPKNKKKKNSNINTVTLMKYGLNPGPAEPWCVLPLQTV